MKKTQAQRQKTKQKRTLHKQQQRANVLANRKGKQMNQHTVGGWDKLKDMYNVHLSVIMSAQPILQMISDDSIIAHIADRATFDRVGMVFANDLSRFRKDLDKIHSEHSSLYGKPATEEEHAAMVTLALRYQQWMASFETVVLPNKVEVMEIVEAAALARSHAQAATPQSFGV